VRVPVTLDIPVAALVLAAPEAPARARIAAATAAEGAGVTIDGLAFVTCQRVELYGEPTALDGIASTGPWAAARRLVGKTAAHHLISTAIGLESAVIAEDQILHQLRSSVAAARERGRLPVELDILSDVALRAGRIARSWRPVRPRSLADLAVDQVAAAHGGLRDRRVLVAGAGEMGRLAAVAARRSGAHVLVASPTAGHARRLADDIGADSVPIDPGRAVGRIDGLIVALSGRWVVGDATREVLERVRVAIDLSMPPALPEGLINALGDRFLDLDQLVAGALDRPAEAVDREFDRYRSRLEGLRDRSVERYLDLITARGRSVTAVALAARLERERSAELEALWRRLPNLPAAERAAIEAMTRHLAKRLLGAPLARIASDPDGRRRRAAEELFDL
jgi:glutamyl-tRNA reductase